MERGTALKTSMDRPRIEYRRANSTRGGCLRSQRSTTQRHGDGRFRDHQKKKACPKLGHAGCPLSCEPLRRAVRDRLHPPSGFRRTMIRRQSACVSFRPASAGLFLLESFTFRHIREADCKIVMSPNRPHVQSIADSTLGRQRLRDTLAPSEER
jgi:hypothetical protein